MDPSELEARNAALRGQVDSTLAGLESQTAQLKEAQAEGMAEAGRSTSQDGLVEATVNAGGIVTAVTFAPAAFDRSIPEKLGETVVQVILQAALSAREQADAAFAPYQEGLPGLRVLFQGAPSLKDLIPAPPPVASRNTVATTSQPSPATTTSRRSPSCTAEGATGDRLRGRPHGFETRLAEVLLGGRQARTAWETLRGALDAEEGHAGATTRPGEKFGQPRPAGGGSGAAAVPELDRGRRLDPDRTGRLRGRLGRVDEAGAGVLRRTVSLGIEIQGAVQRLTPIASGRRGRRATRPAGAGGRRGRRRRRRSTRRSSTARAPPPPGSAA